MNRSAFSTWQEGSQQHCWCAINQGLGFRTYLPGSGVLGAVPGRLRDRMLTRGVDPALFYSLAQSFCIRLKTTKMASGGRTKCGAIFVQ